MKIKSIENGKVKGYVDASNVSRELGADFTTSKIKKNKASFKFTDIGVIRGMVLFYLIKMVQ